MFFFFGLSHSPPLTLSVGSSTGADESTSNYCINMDRGYGHMEAQQALSDVGVYSNSIMQANRVGLPTQWLAQMKKVLGVCADEEEGGDEDGGGGDGGDEDGDN